MSILKKHMPDRYKSVARTIGYCLLLGNQADDWHGLTVVLTARLTLAQRTALAWAALRALPPDTICDVASTVLPNDAGMPMAPFIDVVDEAGFWVELASSKEMDAYVVAIFKAMSAAKRRAFLEFAGRVVA